MPWFNDALAAFCEDHFNVADLPRSIELGSADNETVGFGGGGGGGSSGGGGGGGGGGFLQPTPTNNWTHNTPSNRYIRLRLLNIGLYASSGSSNRIP